MSALLAPNRVAAFHLHARAAVAADVGDGEQVVIRGGVALGHATAAEGGDLIGFAAHFGGEIEFGFAYVKRSDEICDDRQLGVRAVDGDSGLVKVL